MLNEQASGGITLVTGAGGFVGSRLLARLALESRNVRCLQHRSGGNPAHGECEVRTGDIDDSGFVRAAMEGVSCVFHLAAVTSVAEANARPHNAFLVNTSGLQNVLEAARMAGVKKVVLLSTAHVYGRPRSLPVTERHMYAPTSVYAATKLAGDMLALGYHRSFGMNVTILRPFNIYGPGQTPVAVIPEMIQQAVAGHRIRVRDTRPRRDFVFIEDVVDALLLAAGCDAAAGEEILLGSGYSVSIGHVASLIESIFTGREGPPEDEGTGNDDKMLANPEKARKVLGWKPRTDLRTGITRTVNWWRTGLTGYRGSAGM